MAARSDWCHFYTRDDVMKKASLQVKLQLIRKQLDAFAVLEKEVTSHFSEDTFLNNIRRLENTYSKSQLQSLEVVTNLALFRQLLLRLQLDNNHGNRDVDDRGVLEYFVDILRLIDDMKRLNRYFTERVYTPLVENLFPAHGMEKAATPLTGHAQAVTVLSEKGKKTLQARAIENGTQASKCDERTAKFLRTVKRLFKLEQRWSRLSSDGPISVVLFEAETNKNSEETDSVRPFHLISRLVPDLVAKAGKAVAITEKWVTLFVGMSEWAGKDERSSRERQIEELRGKISKTSRTIQELETKLADYREELAGLTAKDARYDELTEAFQMASVSSEELSTDISDLEETEKKMTKQLEEFSRRKDIKEYEELKEEAGHIQQKLQSTRQDLKLASYRSALLRDDMELLLNVLPSFQRLGIGVKQKMANIEEKLKMERERQQKLEEELQSLDLNSKRSDIADAYVTLGTILVSIEVKDV
ncbi:uncharacterized protein LOC118424045 isoform X1 [Branchiostoma floridae]|uniref:Uncharacterized protein LOC118424045 isoform X1 n=1 Tax=Branchiostoma floridae TaxID=7739 RepID=A0A9J7N3J8_BRAFL|nr:uncharacterized protein LOC118424045 isoform X1 [Branchiostoma floridae]